MCDVCEDHGREKGDCVLCDLDDGCGCAEIWEEMSDE